MNNKFYYFDQNNSGGGYHEFNDGKRDMLIEAANMNEANAIAIAHGAYFDGCENGLDCDCCGDRWYPIDDENDFYVRSSVEEFGGMVDKRTWLILKK